ncbi:MAG: hypothetical protein D6753_01385 [Planctomycetota bacterium]|nr:MAG: hypothetical protein D6753_01385 [Planctomycetota bacterium]
MLGFSLVFAGLASILLADSPQDRRLGPARSIPLGRPPQTTVQPVRIQTSDLQVFRRTPIAFSPIEMVDPRTGRRIPPDEILTLGNGTRITAGEYFAELNRIEKDLNALGYSFRNAPTDTVIAKVRLDPRKYSAPLATRAIRSGGRPVVAPGTRVTVEKLEQLAQSQENRPRAENRVAKSEHIVRKPFSYTLGDPDILAAYARGSLELTGKPDGVATRAEAAGGGTVFGRSFDAMYVSFDGHSRAGGDAGVRMQMTALGSTVFNVNRQGTLDETLQRSRPLNLNYGADVPVGPFALAVQLRVQGSVGATVHVSTSQAPSSGDGASVAMNFTPHIDSKLTGTAAIDLKIVSAGVEGRVDLISLDADARGGLTLRNSNGSPRVVEFVTASADVGMLSGKIVPYAKVWNPFGSDKRWSFVLFDWDGIEQHIDLYNSLQVVELTPSRSPLHPVGVQILSSPRTRK